jgi:negative regulator of sigma E activity
MNSEPFTEELLSAYLDGELPAEQQARVERWLAESSKHRRMFDDLQAIRRELQSLPQQSLDAAFSQRVLAAIRQRAEESESAAPADAKSTGSSGPTEDALPPMPKHVSEKLGMPAWRWFAAGMAATLAAILLVVNIAPQTTDLLVLAPQRTVSIDHASAPMAPAPRSSARERAAFEESLEQSAPSGDFAEGAPAPFMAAPDFAADDPPDYAQDDAVESSAGPAQAAVARGFSAGGTAGPRAGSFSPPRSALPPSPPAPAVDPFGAVPADADRFREFPPVDAEESLADGEAPRRFQREALTAKPAAQGERSRGGENQEEAWQWDEILEAGGDRLIEVQIAVHDPEATQLALAQVFASNRKATRFLEKGYSADTRADPETREGRQVAQSRSGEEKARDQVEPAGDKSKKDSFDRDRLLVTSLEITAPVEQIKSLLNQMDDGPSGGRIIAAGITPHEGLLPNAYALEPQALALTQSAPRGVARELNAKRAGPRGGASGAAPAAPAALADQIPAENPQPDARPTEGEETALGTAAKQEAGAPRNVRVRLVFVPAE